MAYSKFHSHLSRMFHTNMNRMVAYTSLAFGVVGIIACACCKDVDSKMTNKVCTDCWV